MEMETCRACLCTDEDLLRVDESFISNYNLLTNLNVNRFDGLPKWFCHLCTQAVNSFIEFREQCISSESTLQEKSLESKSVIFLHDPEFEHEKAKKEPKEEFDEFDETCQYELCDYDVKAETRGTDEECIALIVEEELTPMEETDSTVVKATKRRRFKHGVKKRPKTVKQKRQEMERLAKKQPKAIEKNIKELFCGLCIKSFICSDSLNKHIDSHRDDTSCGVCSKVFENWPKLLAHRAIHANKKHCHLCPRRYYSLYSLEQHYFTVHYDGQVEELSCAQCPKKFTCPRKLSAHEETHNVDCHLCTEVFANRHLLNIHLRTHDTEGPYACDSCEYAAVCASGLENHKKKKHTQVTCNICDGIFADSARLKEHACMKKGKLCPICGKRIYYSLKRHLVVHEDTKKFQCDRCSASFKHRPSLKSHLDRHDNNPKFACDICDRKFYTGSILDKHQRVHTGERPYACKICDKRFKGGSNLKSHMRTHGIMLINKRNKEESPVPFPGSSNKNVTEQ